MTGTLFIFLKAPVAGRVKTRLGAEIGVGRATALFRVMTQQTIARAAIGPWRTVLAVDPPSASSGFGNLWPLHLMRVVQVQGDLGERMGAVAKLAESGPVVIVGADAPSLRNYHIRMAFKKLRMHDAVFGPARDGGYWLIGLARRRAAPNLFENVRWSTAHTLTDTIATLPPMFEISHLPTMTDVDTKADLNSLGMLSTR